MKKFTLLFLGTMAAHLSYGQQTELSVHLTSGFGSYRGKSASAQSIIVLPQIAGMGPYTTNAYGNELAFSYGLAGQIQRVSAGHTLFGMQAGYDVLRSRVQVSSVFDRNGTTIPTDGHSTLTSSFINAHPFLGHRFALDALELDLTAGPEIAYLLRSHEQGEAVSGTGVRYTTDLDHSHPDLDVRGRVNLTAYYKRTGLSVGYSCGLTNYGDYALAGDNNKLYLQAFRVGLSFRLAGS